MSIRYVLRIQAMVHASISDNISSIRNDGGPAAHFMSFGNMVIIYAIKFPKRGYLCFLR